MENPASASYSHDRRPLVNALSFCPAAGDGKNWLGLFYLTRGNQRRLTPFNCLTIAVVGFVPATLVDDNHFLTVCRYVERNALRANLVKRAEDWRWSSLHRWSSGIAAEKELLSPWPVRRNAGWLAHVNSPQTDAELAAIRRSVNRGSPFGDETWATTATKKLGLEITTGPPGRPKLK